MNDASLIHSLAADFSNGVTIQRTEWPTADGRTKACLSGARWRAVVRPQTGKNSGLTLLVLESVQSQQIPTRQPAFRPESVRFVPIWDEQPCDPADIETAYEACVRALRDSEARRRAIHSRLNDLHESRRAALNEARRALSRSVSDEAVKERSLLHSSARKQYSALRVMMDLLRLRSEHEKRLFDAEVEVGTPPKGDPALEPTDEQNLRVRIVGRQSAQAIEEDALVELQHTDNGARPRRARVLSVAHSGQDSIVELDEPAGDYKPGEALRLTILSRFGMWAQQRAIQDLLDERVNGYWPDLAKLVCRPEKLDPPASAPSPRFLCDLDSCKPKLNDRQRSAVAGALATSHAFCIQGPPGTGKTTVICELVQQLIARGERILLAAPTHVAVDEVLRRIGSHDGVRALRLSWNEGRVAEDVRKYTPSRIIDPFVKRAQMRDGIPRDRWKLEQDAINVALLLLDTLKSHRARMGIAQAALDAAARHERDARAHLNAEEPSLNRKLADLTDASALITGQISAFAVTQAAAERAATAARAEASFGTRMLSWVGLGSIGQARRALRAAARSLRDAETQLGHLQYERVSAETELRALRADVTTAAEQLATTSRARDEAASAEAAALADCEGHELLKGTAVAHELDVKRRELLSRHERLDGYQCLGRRFDELVAEAAEGAEDVDALRRDLLAISNLLCCTTTGIAGSRELRDVLVDTFIVDEASRVTDSEFLIGAVRAKRWILVGDEHQLPPYVEQDDEHFLHALSSLHLAERNSVDLEVAVDELGRLWEEDEELHKFRRDSVAAIAEQLRATDEWAEWYRQPYSEGISYLRGEVDDPSRALLRAMRDNLVRSLFERIVSSCPESLRYRLVEQRRMIRPIADIVSDPVYRGDYCSPPDDDLAARGVTPLTTPTFPTPITFLDTSALGIRARDELLRNSFINRTEARWVVEACKILDRELAAAGVRRVSVSILAFYRAQARLVRDLLEDHRGGSRRFASLHFSVIDAIDRIQGQESDVVFLTFCRTAGRNVSSLFGQWLQDLRRLNVACTRAHRALIFVGQKELLGRLCSNEHAQRFYRHLNDLFERRPDVMRIVRQFGRRGG